MSKFLQILFLASVTLILQSSCFSQESDEIKKTRNLVAEIIEKSFPELKNEKINIEIFKSQSNFFKSQFSIVRFLTFQKLNYTIFVNLDVFSKKAPETGIRAILAHELAHILYYKRQSRVDLLGLIALLDKGFTTKFERKTDLEAIKRGYGKGLMEYRRWLYQNVPKKSLKSKKRDYFSPEEIGLILDILNGKPEMIDVWQKNVPRNLEEIKK